MFDKMVRAIFAFLFICLAGPLIPLGFVSWYFQENAMKLYLFFMLGGLLATIPVGLASAASIMIYNKIRWPALIFPPVLLLFFVAVPFSGGSWQALVYVGIAIISAIIMGGPAKWFCDGPAKEDRPLPTAVDALIKNPPPEK